MKVSFKNLLPRFIKRPIAARIRAISDSELLFFQSHPGEDAYCLKPQTSESPNLPVPPKELWHDYATDIQGFLSGGKSDVAEMVRILEREGSALTPAKRILEFGCAAGRMIRHLPEFAPHAELWGVDINARHIQWCAEHLSPMMHFATTTVIPHLPFEDRYFDLVYCGSVFTHIEDIHQSWLLELGRVLRPSGKLFITIHDEHTVAMLDTSSRQHWLANWLQKQPQYTSNKDSFNIIVVGRGTSSQVFYNSQYLKRILPPCFRWLSHTPGAYGYQSAVLLEKVSLA